MNDARYYEINPTFPTWPIGQRPQPRAVRAGCSTIGRAPHPGRRHEGRRADPDLALVRPVRPRVRPVPASSALAEDYADRGLVLVRSGWGADRHAGQLRGPPERLGRGRPPEPGRRQVHALQRRRQARSSTAGTRTGWRRRSAGTLRRRGRSESRGPQRRRRRRAEPGLLHGKGDLVGFATTATVGPSGQRRRRPGRRPAGVADQPADAGRPCASPTCGRLAGTPDYIVVADRFAQERRSPHAYTSYLQTDWRNTVDGRRRRPRLGPRRVGRGRRRRRWTSTSTRTDRSRRRSGSFTPDDAEDWARIGAPGRKAQPRIEMSATGAEYDAITVLVPGAPGEAAPAFHRLAAAGGIATVVDAGPGVTDTLLLATGTATIVEAAGVKTDALVRVGTPRPRRGRARHDGAGHLCGHRRRARAVASWRVNRGA